MAEQRVAVRGSARRPMRESSVVGSPDPYELIDVTIYLRRRSEPAAHEGPVSHEEFEARYGADLADVEAVERFAEEFDLTVVGVDLARRSVRLSGTVADFNDAFATELRIFQAPEGLYRGRVGELFVPANLADAITGVFGLDSRPQARVRLRRHVEGVTPRAAGDTSYTPTAVAKLYDFPSGATGAGQTVAIIELGGGYRSADLKNYFKSLGIKPTPTVTAVGVDGASNTPAGGANTADGEVLLDIEVVGAIAPKARIAVYFAPNTDQGFLDAITTAIHDKARNPTVISISWGAAESAWTEQALTSFDQAFQDAGLLGVTVCCASGDNGSDDGVGDGAAHVDFPASSPNVLGCGGTRLESSGSTVTKEVVWNEGSNGATGGGVSEHFPLPAYQANAGVPVSANPSKFRGRGVPDVAGDADPATGYQVLVDGRKAVFGGTSAVAPLWAALIAMLNQQSRKRLGFANQRLYGLAAGLRDITSGSNGAYDATKGWDACTGLGSPDGAGLLKALGHARHLSEES